MTILHTGVRNMIDVMILKQKVLLPHVNGSCHIIMSKIMNTEKQKIIVNQPSIFKHH